MLKKISHIIPSNSTHMVGDGFKVSNLMPGYGNPMTSETSPLLLVDYGKPWEIEGDSTREPRGVGYHPHRGFETVTILYSGEVSHHDTTGAGGTIHQDEIQWMTAGAGLLHKEYHSEAFTASGGTFHVIQLWFDLPSKQKLTPPRYQSLTKDIIPEIEIDGGKLRLISGTYKEYKGVAQTFSPIDMYDIRIETPTTLDLKSKASYNTFIINVEGEHTINGRGIPPHSLVHFETSGWDINIVSKTPGKLLFISGAPLNQSVYNYGPFVMDTQIGLQEAFADYRNGVMGFPPEE